MDLLGLNERIACAGPLIPFVAQPTACTARAPAPGIGQGPGTLPGVPGSRVPEFRAPEACVMRATAWAVPWVAMCYRWPHGTTGFDSGKVLWST
jgi:hypothetical protein